MMRLLFCQLLYPGVTAQANLVRLLTEHGCELCRGMHLMATIAPETGRGMRGNPPLLCLHLALVALEADVVGGGGGEGFPADDLLTIPENMLTPRTVTSFAPSRGFGYGIVEHLLAMREACPLPGEINVADQANIRSDKVSFFLLLCLGSRLLSEALKYCYQGKAYRKRHSDSFSYQAAHAKHPPHCSASSGEILRLVAFHTELVYLVTPRAQAIPLV